MLYFCLFSTEIAPETSIKSKTKDKNEQTKSDQGESALQSLPQYDLIITVNKLSHQEHGEC